MKAMTHPEAQEWILSGQALDPEESASLSEHLACCPQCREFAAFHQELLAAVPYIAPAVTHSEREIRQKTAAAQARLKQRTVTTRFFHGTRALALVFSALGLVALLVFAIVRLIPDQNRVTPGGLEKTATAAQASLPASSATPLATFDPTSTAAPISTPDLAALQALLRTFPLVPGAQWVYTDTEYDPALNDPTQTMQAVFEITESVIEVKTIGPDYFAHLKRMVSPVSADPAWSDQSHSPAADSDWWYIIHAGRVYSIPSLPSDPQAIDFKVLTLEYQFPLAVDAQWCPNPVTLPYTDPTTPTDVPCAYQIGMRIAQNSPPYTVSGGSFPACFLLTDVYNTGNILQTFCNGVGVVQRKFDHPGTRFGFNWVLKSFTNVSSGPTSTPAPRLTDEQVLARALLNTDQKAYCSWQILEQSGDMLGAWVLCELQVEPYTAGSVPVVIHLNQAGHYGQVDIPRDGNQYVPDIQRLFPLDIQTKILGNNFDLKSMEQGIARRKTGEFTVPYIIPSIDFVPWDCSWVNEPVPDVLGAQASALSGWSKVTLPKAGFTLDVPQYWRVVQFRQSSQVCGSIDGEPHFLKLQTPDGNYQLTIGFRQPDQLVYITPTFTWLGDFVDAGQVSFFGMKIPASRRVYQGRNMAVFYNSASEFPVGGNVFTLLLTFNSDPLNNESIPSDVEDQARQILASFQPYTPAGPNPTATLSIPTTLTPSPTPAILPDGIQITEQARWGKGSITGSEFSPDGKRLGVVTTPGIYIYDAENLQQLDFIPGGSPWHVAAFSPDWSLLAIGSGSTITLLRLPDKTEVAHLETDQGKVTRLLFSPDGRSLASLVQPPGEEVYTQILDLWGVSDGKLLATWKAGSMPDLAFTPDSKMIYAWNRMQMAGVFRWQIPSGSPLPVLKDLSPDALAFSPDGSLMVSAGNSTNSGILIQRVSDGAQVRTLAWEPQGFAGKLLFSPDGSLLAAFSYDGFVKVWRIADGTLIQSFDGISANTQFLAISPDDQTLVLPAADGLVFYSLANGQTVRQLGGHFNAIGQAALSPSGDKVAALISSTDPETSSLVVWTFPEGQRSYSLARVGALGFAWSPDGDRLALAGWDGKIRILRSTDGTVIQTLAGHSQQVQSVAWSPDGTQLASSSFSVKVWQVADGTLLYDLSGSGQWINSLNFSPDGSMLAGSDSAGKIEVWQTGGTKRIAELPVSAYGDSNVIAFAPDGSFLAVAEMSRVSLWHLNEEQPFLTLPITAGGVITLRISPDGSLLACGLTTGAIQLWQVSGGKLLQTLMGGSDGISSLDFSNDGKTLLSGSRDGTIRFWNIHK